jgi:3-oxoacyl-[acyl-carrier protein] reductase
MKSSRFNGKVALVTGAGRGIGVAIARRFADEGANVVVTDLNPDSARLVEVSIVEGGGNAISMGLDVTDSLQARNVVEEVVQRFGRLDIQVNNAGIAQRATFLDMTLEVWERILRTNLTGTMICAQASARAMKATGGRIVNIASISGQLGGSERAAYGASKAGVINLTQVMAIELAPYNILVNAIAPGPTAVGPARNTPRQQQASFSRMAIPRFASPDEIAAAAAFLASDDCSMTTGHVLNVDGGFASAGIIYRDEVE